MYMYTCKRIHVPGPKVPGPLPTWVLSTSLVDSGVHFSLFCNKRAVNKLKAQQLHREVREPHPKRNLAHPGR